jgi:hypothetical protein
MPVLIDHTAAGRTTIDATVLKIRVMGTTPGRRNIVKEKRPDAQAANNNP